MHLLAMLTFSTAGLPWLAIAATLLVGFAFSHQGVLDQSALQDIILGEVVSTAAAVAAGTTFLANQLTGAGEVLFTNTQATPGTLTTRTAAQMFADLTAQIGFAPPPGYQYSLVLVHQGAGTLTLAGGTGVTLSSLSGGPTTVATATARKYVVTVANSNTITIQNVGALAT